MSDKKSNSSLPKWKGLGSKSGSQHPPSDSTFGVNLSKLIDEELFRRFVKVAPHETVVTPTGHVINLAEYIQQDREERREEGYNAGVPVPMCVTPSGVMAPLTTFAAAASATKKTKVPKAASAAAPKAAKAKPKMDFVEPERFAKTEEELAEKLQRACAVVDTDPDIYAQMATESIVPLFDNSEEMMEAVSALFEALSNEVRVVDIGDIKVMEEESKQRQAAWVKKNGPLGVRPYAIRFHFGLFLGESRKERAKAILAFFKVFAQEYCMMTLEELAQATKDSELRTYLDL